MPSRVDNVKRWAEVFDGRMVAKHERDDDKIPEFAGARFAVDITDELPEPQPGWLWDGSTWTESTVPVSELRLSQLDQMDAKLDQILRLLQPGPP